MKDNKISQAHRGSAICCLQKSLSAYLNQITQEIMFLLVNDLHEKSITVSQDTQNFDRVRACTIHVTFVIK